MSPENIHKAYERIRKLLEDNYFEVSDHKSISYGLQFSITSSEQTGIIRLYQNKKGHLNYDFSQIKDSLFANKVMSLIEGEANKKESSEKKSYDYGFPIIGTDESGKGDYFGPLVSAGVYLDEHLSKLLAVEGIKDSKKLSDKKNQELAQKIMKICVGKYSVVEILPGKYNDLYEQFIKEHKNLNTMLAWGHAKAIEELLSRVECQTAIADQFADERFIQSKLQERGKQIKLIQMHKAEQNIAVAAASILARARFLDKLAKLSSNYNVDLPKGVSSAVVDTAKQIVKEHGMKHLRKVAKLHFKTTKEVITDNV